MKKLKHFTFILVAFLISYSCSQEESIAEIETANRELSKKAPSVHFLSSSQFCKNGPQVKLKFIDCHHTTIFYVNVFNSNGTHLYSWPVDNSYLNHSVSINIGSPPFTYPDGSSACSLFDEGETYYFITGGYTTSDVTNQINFDSFYIPYDKCYCTG